AGVACRADDLRSLVAFYAMTDVDNPGVYSVRMAAFKYGGIVGAVGLRKSVAIPGGEAHLSLQFFFGQLVGRLTTTDSTVTLAPALPYPAFRGHAGVLRFYDASVFAKNIQIEEIRMRPVLPEATDPRPEQYTYRVFLCHSSADKPIVRQFTQRLTA